MTGLKSSSFFELIKNRRSIYPLKAESPISDKQIQEIVENAILHIPSSFNSQSTRAVILFKSEHKKLWDITKEALKAIVPAADYPTTEQKLNMFQGAYGTVLFFEARTPVQNMQKAYAAYADNFPIWASQSDGMSQFATWTALEAEGFGANLQHYSPLIAAKVASTWGIDEDWVLNAQLVFGTPVAPAGEKTFEPIESRVKVFGAN